MKVLLVDNEPEIRTAVARLIRAFCPTVVTLHEADGVASGLQALQDHAPDLLITDIEMDDGTGMDLVTQGAEHIRQVIFITAYNKYAIEAFRLSAIDFLLKPVDPEELVRAVHKAAEQLRNEEMRKQFQVLVEATRLAQDEKKLVLKEQGAMHIIRVKDLLYCKADRIYTEFHTAGGQRIIISTNLKEYEELLEPWNFVRVHHSWLINMNRIIRFDKKDGDFIVMENNIQIPVAQRRKDQVLAFLKRLN